MSELSPTDLQVRALPQAAKDAASAKDTRAIVDLRPNSSTPAALVLYGATGDLARRMLFPALYHLWRENRLDPAMRLVAAARSDTPVEAFRAHVAEGLATNASESLRDMDDIARFADRVEYLPVDGADAASVERLADALALQPGQGCLHYFAVAPALYGALAANLGRAGLAATPSRVVLEKPIGHDLASSAAINDAVGAVFPEERTFRIDHYLGKETVQNLLALRFGNSLFEPLWSAANVAQVQITIAETVGLEARAGYYDRYGAMRDMVQNHMLQLLALVAMEPPNDLDASAVRNEKIKALRSLRPIAADIISRYAVAGQYTAGMSGGTAVRGYADELGAQSNTETFVAVRADLDNWRWAGVPFYLRTGKRLPARYSEIIIQFRAVPHSIFKRDGGVLAPNKLIIRLQPEETIRLTLMAKEPGLEAAGARLRELPLDLSLAEAFKGERRRIAYERLLLDAIAGNPTLFVRRDEVEAAWHWVDSIEAGWRAQGQPPKPYAAGSWGPASAIALAERFGDSWHE